MQTSLIHFQTSDTLRLPGLFYEPQKKSNKVALYLHGNGTSSIFYSTLTPVLGKQLTDAGIAYFPFNNRGAHLIKSFKIEENGVKKRVLYGTAYERIKECILDIDGAITALSKHGYTEFYLIGESTGANKIVVYHYYNRQNPVAKYVLLSGGDDTGLYYNELGDKEFYKALHLSKAKIDEGNGVALVPAAFSPFPYSYQALYDVINPDGDYNIFPYNEYFNKLQLSKKKLYREYSTIDKPSLVIYGEHDEYCYGDVPRCIEALKQHTSHPEMFTYEMIEGADHGFSGMEVILSQTIVKWLKG